MCVCARVPMCVHMDIICVRVRVCTCVLVCMHVNMCACVCVCVCVCMRAHEHVCQAMLGTSIQDRARSQAHML